MLYRQLFDDKLAQYAYLIGCQQTGEALLIDPERDIDRYLQVAESEGLRVTAVAETHIHADFLSGARELAERFDDVALYLSDEGDADWKYEWVHQGDYDYHLLHDGDTFTVGNIEIEAVHTPGHTPEHLSYLVTDRGGGADKPLGIATGDFVFVGDLGRPDLLETAAGFKDVMRPSAKRLYHSLKRFTELPDYVQVWPGHGAGSACGKALGAVPQATIGYEKQFNPALQAAEDGEDAFVDFILEGQPEPPLYFKRMKRDNKQGPKVLGALPAPRRLTADELGTLTERKEAAVVDTRTDRTAFMAGHLPGSLYAPLSKLFPTVAGSYVEEETPIYLIVEEARVEEAVRDLVRIGLDCVKGYATPETLQRYGQKVGTLASTREVTFDEVEELRRDPQTRIVDVRGLSEYASGHVPGAQNVAYTRLLERRDELPPDRRLVVHCGSGVRAAVASALLEHYGHDVVYVNDAFARWAEVGEVEKALSTEPVA